jgi:hypothetical protein
MISYRYLLSQNILYFYQSNLNLKHFLPLLIRPRGLFTKASFAFLITFVNTFCFIIRCNVCFTFKSSVINLIFPGNLFYPTIKCTTTLSIMTFSIKILNITVFSIMALNAECCFADCHFCWMAFLLSVTSKLYMLSVVMLNVVAPNKRTEIFD